MQVRCFRGEGKAVCFQVGLKHRSFPRAKPSDRRSSEKGHGGVGLQPGGILSTPPNHRVAWGSETSNCPGSCSFWELESQQGWPLHSGPKLCVPCRILRSNCSDARRDLGLEEARNPKPGPFRNLSLLTWGILYAQRALFLSKFEGKLCPNILFWDITRSTWTCGFCSVVVITFA